MMRRNKQNVNKQAIEKGKRARSAAVGSRVARRPPIESGAESNEISGPEDGHDLLHT